MKKGARTSNSKRSSRLCFYHMQPPQPSRTTVVCPALLPTVDTQRVLPDSTLSPPKRSCSPLLAISRRVDLVGLKKSKDEVGPLEDRQSSTPSPSSSHQLFHHIRYRLIVKEKRHLRHSYYAYRC